MYTALLPSWQKLLCFEKSIAPNIYLAGPQGFQVQGLTRDLSYASDRLYDKAADLTWPTLSSEATENSMHASCSQKLGFCTFKQLSNLCTSHLCMSHAGACDTRLQHRPRVGCCSLQLLHHQRAIDMAHEWSTASCAGVKCMGGVADPYPLRQLAKVRVCVHTMLQVQPTPVISLMCLQRLHSLSLAACQYRLDQQP